MTIRQQTPSNALYAQSGGVTSVINASACGVIETVRKNADRIPHLYCGRDGIVGILTEDLIDTGFETKEDIAGLRYTPGGAFGSCRYKLKSPSDSLAQYERLLAVFRAHNIGYFFYNGGNDSMDTASKIADFCQQRSYPVVCVGIPKTIDNDLVNTDCCPGFGSVAKYVATSIYEAGLDLASMARTSTKVFIMEVMGRNAGWITAACGLASRTPQDPPHILLFPEIPLDQKLFLKRVERSVVENGYCVIGVSEGLRGADGKILSESGSTDAFGHAQLGGIAPLVAGLIKKELGYKYHWAVVDYLQRSARHIASAVDENQSYAVACAAVEYALAGKSGVMASISRLSSAPYRWEVVPVPLSEVANREKMMPRDFITSDGWHITSACREYLAPLIEGESYPPFKGGLPDYVRLKNQAVPKKIAEPFKV